MNKNRAIVAAVVVVAVALAAAVLMRGGEKSAVAEKQLAAAQAPKPAASAPAAPAAPAAAPSVDVPAAPQELPEIVPEEPINYYNGMNPEDQPRAYYELMFSELDKLPPGFVADGVVLTDMGLQLAPGMSEGTLISAAERFDFPANAVGPMWMENLPPGTDFMLEIAVSPDGEIWGPWQYVTIDTDSYGQMEQYYSNGRPNPNYGYSPGGLLAWGDMQFGYMKYKLTLLSESEDTPTIASVRAHYQDSTMGEGHMATVAELEADLVGESTPPLPEEIIVYNPVYNPDEHVEEDELQPGDVVRVEGTPENF